MALSLDDRKAKRFCARQISESEQVLCRAGSKGLRVQSAGCRCGLENQDGSTGICIWFAATSPGDYDTITTNYKNGDKWRFHNQVQRGYGQVTATQLKQPCLR